MLTATNGLSSGMRGRYFDSHAARRVSPIQSICKDRAVVQVLIHFWVKSSLLLQKLVIDHGNLMYYVDTHVEIPMCYDAQQLRGHCRNQVRSRGAFHAQDENEKS
jgi:hypothetical protein